MISTDGGLLVFYFSGLFCAQKYTLKNSNFCLDNGEYLNQFDITDVPDTKVKCLSTTA